MEDFQHSRNNSPLSRPNIGSGNATSTGAGSSSNATSRSHTPSRVLHFEQISVHNASPREPSALGQINGVAIAKEVLAVPSSEETSFIASDDLDRARQRGTIETV